MENSEVIGVSYVTPAYIKELRKRLGMTQGDFAEALGTTQIQISLLETGKRKLSPMFQKKVSDFEKRKKKEEKSLMAILATSTKHVTTEVFYPDSDGKPMADNTLQALWIILMYSNLRALFNGKKVFVAADLLWYPVEGEPHTKVAPDVLVVFDRPDGYRGSYKQWYEENTPLSVVFEVLSPSNTAMEMLNKRDFYERHGVSEFIILDPQKNEFTAYISVEGKLERADKSGEVWESPRLGITIQILDKELTVQYPNGSPFRSFEEIQVEKEELQAEKEVALEAKNEALLEVERLKARLRELGESLE